MPPTIEIAYNSISYNNEQNHNVRHQRLACMCNRALLWMAGTKLVGRPCTTAPPVDFLRRLLFQVPLQAPWMRRPYEA